MAYAPAMTLTGGWARFARAGVFGGASLFLATAGHVVGGGALPGAGLLVLTAIGLALLSVTLTVRRLRFGVLLAALGLEQLLLHLLFHASTAAATCASMMMPGHTMSTAVCGSGTSTAASWPMVLATPSRCWRRLGCWLAASAGCGQWPTGSTGPPDPHRAGSVDPAPSSSLLSRRSSFPRAGSSPVPEPRRSPDPTSSRTCPFG